MEPLLLNLTISILLDVAIKNIWQTNSNDDKPNNDNFQNKMEKVQYRDCLAITSGIQGTSREQLYDELGLHSLVKRRWHNKLIFFHKIVNRLLPNYLYYYLDLSSQKNYLLISSSASII